MFTPNSQDHHAAPPAAPLFTADHRGEIAPAAATVRAHCAITLVQPGRGGDLTEAAASLLEVLRARRSERALSERPIDAAVLAQLLWAACGVNRPDDGGRTAPSAKNWREIELYVASADGLFLYEPNAHLLHHLSRVDLRAATGLQDFVAHAPVNLIFVANLAKAEDAGREEQQFFAALDTGFISQNVYLFCAAQGLATVVRGWLDRSALARAMGLGAQQQIIVAQSIGYPPN